MSEPASETLKAFERLVLDTPLYTETGRITRSVGLIFEGFLPHARLGAVVKIFSRGHPDVFAEVIGFKDKKAVMMPFGEFRGINTESRIQVVEHQPTARVGMHLLGRTIDALGQPLDGLDPFPKEQRRLSSYPLYHLVSNPLERDRIEQPLDLGIRAMNGFLTCGQGQRLGIMAGSGVGKSTLLGMMARNSKSDINVIALVGERGREVKEFVERDLGPDGLKRSVVVAVTGDKSPLLRMRGAYLATAISEYFCDQGANVLLMMDSVTRFCMAQREIGLSLGEPPASKGYTPSVFASLPKLLERAGRFRGRGSITGLYTVLVDGDDMDEPIADAARAILDGHIVLSRSLAAKNHYPPIDISVSVSRCMSDIVGDRHKKSAAALREMMAIYRSNEDLISIGAYVKGSNPKVDQAILLNDRINQFLRQATSENTSLRECVQQMESLSSLLKGG